MEVLYPVCCALDVHQASVTACLRSPGDGPQRRQEVRTFGTTTRELLCLADWLTAAGCTHVAMESTGIYWRPVYNILEGRCELSVVNAQHVKMVPGRKTDVRDSEWLAQLLELGLLRRSFVPPAAQRELRDVVRYRKRLIEERAREANRVQKVLETANIKLASVVTTVLGVSARAMLKALIAGEQAPEQLADLAKRRPRRCPQTRLLPRRPVPPARQAPRRQEGHRCRRPQHPRHRLPRPAGRPAVSRTRQRLLRAAERGPPHPLPYQAPRRPRLHRDPDEVRRMRPAPAPIYVGSASWPRRRGARDVEDDRRRVPPPGTGREQPDRLLHEVLPDQDEH